MTKTIHAYHFVADKLRDGRPVPPIGKKLVHDGELRLCASGLHASLSAFDALKYAPGNNLCYVKCSGEIIYGDDKLVCSERTIIKRFNAENLLREFARKCALDVLPLWDAPEVVVQYLRTGDENLRSAANSAAWSADNSAAYYAADSARYAANSAADSARYAADYAAVYAAHYSAHSAAHSAADSARYAADYAANSAAYSAARSAAEEKQAERFNRMVRKEFKL